jgi:hypothetical protein
MDARLRLLPVCLILAVLFASAHAAELFYPVDDTGQDRCYGHRRPPQGRRPSVGDFVRRLDKDNDSKVSKAECDGPARHFPHLDRNGEGSLGEDETLKGPPPRRRS